ncbi:MAG: hypothetical protein AAGE94_01485 [Acidobacteriota bacterium]
MIKFLAAPPSTLRNLLLCVAVLGLIACGGDDGSATSEGTPAEAPQTEEVSPEPTYEPASEVITPEAGTDGNAEIDPSQVAVETATDDDPGAVPEDPQPAVSAEPDVD